MPSPFANFFVKTFAEYPGLAKYFNVTLSPDGKPDPLELERIAGERVLIKLRAA